MVDLEEHSLSLMDANYKETVRMCRNIQSYIESQTEELPSIKLSHLTSLLLKGDQEEEWMGSLAKSIKVTQMYDFFAYKK